MSNKVSFCRKYPVEILLEKKAKTLAFFYELTVGFFGVTDPDSGMSVSLVDMDSWAHEFLNLREAFSDESKFLKKAAAFFQTKGTVARLSIQNQSRKFTIVEGQVTAEYFHELAVEIAGEARSFLITTTNEKSSELQEEHFSSLEDLCEKLRPHNVSSLYDRMNFLDVRFKLREIF